MPGIARAHLIKMCARLEISVEEREYTLEELMNADEIIVSSSSNFCLKVEEVDGIKVGGQAQAPAVVLVAHRKLRKQIPLTFDVF